MKELLVFAIIVMVLGSCTDRLKAIESKFGTNQNSERTRLHLVEVNPNFKIKEDETYQGRRFIFVHKNQLNISSPEYLRKIIMLDSTRSTLLYEEDYFADPTEKKELVTTHNYYLKETRIFLQSADRSDTINAIQADSVLRVWKIPINPFKRAL